MEFQAFPSYMIEITRILGNVTLGETGRVQGADWALRDFILRYGREMGFSVYDFDISCIILSVAFFGFGFLTLHASTQSRGALENMLPY